jgi:hypothetical protein
MRAERRPKVKDWLTSRFAAAMGLPLRSAGVCDSGGNLTPKLLRRTDLTHRAETRLGAGRPIYSGPFFRVDELPAI